MVRCIWCGEEIEGSVKEHMAEKHVILKKQEKTQPLPIAPTLAITPKTTTVNTTEKPFIGKDGLKYFGMNWYAAQALLQNPKKEYPYGKNVIFVPAKETWTGEREWTETHEKLEIAELEPIFKAKGILTLKDYYDGHTQVLIKMKDLDLAELEHTEVPYVLQKIKNYLEVEKTRQNPITPTLPLEKPKKRYLNADEIITLLHNVNQTFPKIEIPPCPINKQEE
jgi:hypothetical protein